MLRATIEVPSEALLHPQKSADFRGPQQKKKNNKNTIDRSRLFYRFAIIENALRLQENAPQSLASICVRYAFGPRGLSVNILMRAYERAPRRSLCCSRSATDVPSSATYLLATDCGFGNPMVSDSTVENKCFYQCKNIKK